MMFFVYTYILNQHHNFVNSFIYKLPINCIFIQIDTAKFVADKQKKPQKKRLRLRKHSVFLIPNGCTIARYSKADLMNAVW